MKLESSNREIETEYLKIHGNCMEFKNTIIQLSNVSLISNEEISPIKFPLWTLAVIVIGLIMFAFKSTVTTLLGIVLIICGGIVVFQWYSRSEKNKQLEKLLIMTNSGNMFTIIFNDRSFLNRVIQVLKEVVSNPGHLSDVTINIKENTFTGGSSAIHDYAEINY